MLCAVMVSIYEPETLRVTNHANAEHLFWVLFASLSSCLGQLGDEQKVSFPKIVSLGIEPVVSSLSIAKSTLCYGAIAAYSVMETLKI